MPVTHSSATRTVKSSVILCRLANAKRLTRACDCGAIREAISPVLYWE